MALQQHMKCMLGQLALPPHYPSENAKHMGGRLLKAHVVDWFLSHFIQLSFLILWCCHYLLF